MKRLHVHFDPYNPSAVWVKTPEGGFIECPVRDWNAISSPFFGELQPDNDTEADIEAEQRLAQRAEVALVGATLAGTPLHQLPTLPPAPLLPTDYNDIDEDDDLPEFNPEGNQS